MKHIQSFTFVLVVKIIYSFHPRAYPVVAQRLYKINSLMRQKIIKSKLFKSMEFSPFIKTLKNLNNKNPKTRFTTSLLHQATKYKTSLLGHTTKYKTSLSPDLYVASFIVHTFSPFAQICDYHFSLQWVHYCGYKGKQLLLNCGQISCPEKFC